MLESARAIQRSNALKTQAADPLLFPPALSRSPSRSPSPSRAPSRSLSRSQSHLSHCSDDQGGTGDTGEPGEPGNGEQAAANKDAAKAQNGMGQGEQGGVSPLHVGWQSRLLVEGGAVDADGFMLMGTAEGLQVGEQGSLAWGLVEGGVEGGVEGSVSVAGSPPPMGSLFSPEAPAPSHLPEGSKESMESLEAQLMSALANKEREGGDGGQGRENGEGRGLRVGEGLGEGSSVEMGGVTAPPSTGVPGSASYTIESVTLTHTGETEAGTNKRNLASRAEAQRARSREVRDRIRDRAPSAALKVFAQYMGTANNPRRFYEGKKRASAASRFGLSSELRTPADVHKASALELLLLGTAKSPLSAELTLFHSLFPQASAEQEAAFVQARRQARRRERDGPGEGEGEGVTDLSVTSSEVAEGVASNQSFRGTGFLPDDEEEEEEDEGDPDILSWQHFTIDVMRKEKTGPKSILPVLIVKNEGGSSSKRFAVNKSRRWGSGALIKLASEADEGPIAGPSSYLDICKKQRMRISDKQRREIQVELLKFAK
ncbi:hypothetical protein B484DRAFT_432778 [Ochromonadaceae sp. CCMP2298]|nr:hypothetical protein B484DRAFT_432778 [Ochromonadaceae sp. CCMP2298]